MSDAPSLTMLSAVAYTAVPRLHITEARCAADSNALQHTEHYYLYDRRLTFSSHQFGFCSGSKYILLASMHVRR
jgi:hypothetical protein